jgi:hypothetical protein
MRFTIAEKTAGEFKSPIDKTLNLFSFKRVMIFFCLKEAFTSDFSISFKVDLSNAIV